MAFSKARRLSDFIAADGTIPTAKFASGTITSAHIADTAITHADLHTDMNLTSKTVLVANASTGDSDTTAANTAFVQQEIAALVDSSPSALNTLNELAAALGDDANFSTTVNASIAAKLPLAGGTMTGALAMGSNAITSTGTISSGAITSSGDIKTTGLLEVASSQPRILLDRSDGSYSWNIYNGDGTGNFPTSTFNIANNAGTAVITAVDNGNVGIGVNVPGDNLHILGTTTTPNVGIKLQSDDTANATATLTLMARLSDNTNKSVTLQNYRGNLIIDGETNYGKVGIGTTTPASPLSVQGSSTDGGTIAVFDGGDLNQGFHIVNFTCGSDEDRVGLIWENQGVALTRMWMGQDSKLYSKASNPTSGTDGNAFVQETHTGSLTLNVSSNSTILLENAGTNAAIIKSATGDELYLGANNSYAMRLRNDGTNNVTMDNGTAQKLGVGTSSPSEQIHSSGNIRAEGNFYDYGSSINMLSLDVTKFYPVSLNGGSAGHSTRFKLEKYYASGNGSHGLLGSAYLIMDMFGYSWGGNPVYNIVRSAYSTYRSMIGAVTLRGYYVPVIWLRGGYSYSYRCDKPITIDIKTTAVQGNYGAAGGTYDYWLGPLTDTDMQAKSGYLSSTIVHHQSVSMSGSCNNWRS